MTGINHARREAVAKAHADGLTVKQASERLWMTPWTIRHYAKAIGVEFPHQARQPKVPVGRQALDHARPLKGSIPAWPGPEDFWL